jgi:tRNA dimethylallyltransferase
VVTPPPLVAIVGPTGVGKTAVAVRLAASLPIEAINADSRQVYRGMTIGTGKPTAEQQAALPHHLVDVADPDQRYHAARFRADALCAIGEVRARGKLPVVVGGTGLYVRALLKGLHPAPPADLELRRGLEDEVRAHGSGALHARLAALDPAAARGLHPNDRVRIVRALEIFTLTHGVPPDPAEHARADWRRGVAGWRLVMIGLRRERRALNRTIADRARAMVARGMMDEVRTLLASGYDETLPSMGGIGYRQLAGVIRGDMSLDEAVARMIRDTERYAKRQMTWFAREREIRWIDVDEAGGAEGAATTIRDVVAEEGLLE